MISVIIPTLNESECVASVVELARANPDVGEVIVVDDGSIDGTPERACAAGARVITSTLLGKGASMADGLHAAQHEILVFLDGDLKGLCEDLVARLTEPIRCGLADFVKARFSRCAGRVTALTAKPLLRTFFPELMEFEQPLSGIIAAKRSLLRKLRFENDYGVDAGLFIDATMCAARIAEVDIGHLEHDSHPLEVLGDMATQVARTILNRAGRYARLKAGYIHDVQEIERQTRAELAVNFLKPEADLFLALFDMDGVLLQERFVAELARRTQRTAELLVYLNHARMNADERSGQIASLFKGVPRDLFERVARDMPLTPGAIEAVVGIRKLGYRVGIVSDSYCVATEIVRRRVFADFSVAHVLKFRSGKATGELTLSPAMVHPRGCPLHLHCKLNVLKHLEEKSCLARGRTLAVGDGENDICLLQGVALSVAFQPKSPRVRAAAAHVLEESLCKLPEIAQSHGAVGLCA